VGNLKGATCNTEENPMKTYYAVGLSMLSGVGIGVRAALAAVGLVAVAGTAVAADMTGDEIKAMISGKTVYLECGATSTGGQGQGVIYYGADGSALYKSAGRGMLSGTWSIKDNTSCTDWKQAPNNPCSRYDKQGDTITLINVATNQPRCKISKTAPGNAENLAP
jgi:hypothetical protein